MNLHDLFTQARALNTSLLLALNEATKNGDTSDAVQLVDMATAAGLMAERLEAMCHAEQMRAVTAFHNGMPDSFKRKEPGSLWSPWLSDQLPDFENFDFRLP